MRGATEKPERPTPVCHVAGTEDRQSGPYFSHLTNGQSLRDGCERVDRTGSHDEGYVRLWPSFQGLLGPVGQMLRQPVCQVELQSPVLVGFIKAQSQEALVLEKGGGVRPPRDRLGRN